MRIRSADGDGASPGAGEAHPRSEPSAEKRVPCRRAISWAPRASHQACSSARREPPPRALIRARKVSDGAGCTVPRHKIMAAPVDFSQHIDDLETQGFTVIPGVFSPEFCARARAHMDEILVPPDQPRSAAAARSHPIPGSIMAEMCTAPTFLAAAEALWRAPAAELRLNEQVPIRK